MPSKGVYARVCNAMRRHASRQKTILLSEENWIGHPHAGCNVPPYPELEDRLGFLRHRPDGDRLHFFVALRNPAGFVPSVVAEALRHSPRRVSLARARENWLNADAPWSELLERLRRSFPEAELTVWRHEDYRANAPAILGQLVGVAIPELPAISDPPETKRPSAPAVQMMRALRWLPEPPRNWLCHALADFGEGEKFTLFSPDEAAALTETYTAECESIRRNFNMLEF